MLDSAIKKLAMLFLVIFVLLGAFPSVCVAQDKLVIYATNYPPYEFEQPEDGKRGFDLEVVEEALHRAGYEVEFQFYPWSRVMKKLKKNNILAALSCMRTPEREQFLAFSDPISKLTEVLMVRKEYPEPVPSRYADFHGIEIGSMIDWVFTEKLEKWGIPHDVSPDEKVAIRKLADGRVDALLVALESTQYWVKSMGMPDTFKWKPVEGTFSEYNLCFSKEYPETPEVLSVFNEKLAEMKADGTYDAIHARYK
ncbi:MAG: transporter substrate-binding domain-containing protein [Pseudodesulfovibrio sp.]